MAVICNGTMAGHGKKENVVERTDVIRRYSKL